MESTFAAQPVSRGHEYIFDELIEPVHLLCELCKREQAAYAWREQKKTGDPKPQMAICRVCAGMILLIGKSRAMQ